MCELKVDTEESEADGVLASVSLGLSAVGLSESGFVKSKGAE